MTQEGKASALTLLRSEPRELTAAERQLAQDMETLKAGQAQIVSALLALQSECARLNRALSTVRVSRTQELALCEAIRARAKELARAEDLPGSEKRIAAAIRTTLREVTGARAYGDVQAGQFDRAMELVTTWRMAGALRRIRRAAEGGA